MTTLYEMSSLKHSADLLVKVNKIQNAAYKPVPSFDQLFIYLLLFTLLLWTVPILKRKWVRFSIHDFEKIK